MRGGWRQVDCWEGIVRAKGVGRKLLEGGCCVLVAKGGGRGG